MKQLKKYIIGLIACASLTQCDVLDVDPTGWYSENVAYASLENVDLYVKGLYSVMYENATININAYCIMDDGISDLLKYSWYGVEGGTINRFFYEDNFISPEGNFRSNWNGMYLHIRRLNEFFYDCSKGYGSDLDQAAMNIRKAEIRFLRAFAYQELVIRHGGVILRTEEDRMDGPDERAKARSSESECWDFILGEYEKAANDLPETWSGDDAGRITKVAAYGMKARAALYAKRYDEAIAACDKVESLKPEGLLPGTTYNDYYKIFTTPHNSELLLAVYFQQGENAKQHAFDNRVCPPYDWKAAGTTEGSVGAAVTPTDEYASSFDIKVNGTYQPFNWEDLSKYNNKPFDNREPRFYASILYNGASWKERTIELFENGKDGYMDFKKTGQDNVHKSTTGYLIRKFVSNDPKINFSSILSGQYWIEMRLAEIFLIHSEACARKNDFTKAYYYLNEIRKRVGLPALGIKTNWDSYLEDLSKERICELGMEGHRYFDLIRWGKAVETLDHSHVHGIKITKNGNDFKYEKVDCDTQDRLFPERYTIFPIPTTEIKNNILCEQNELWKQY